MAYRVIEAQKATYTIKRMCELLEVSRSAFYQWRADLDAQVAASHTGSDGVYGTPRILAELRTAGETMSRVKRWRPRCAAKDWQGSARGPSRRPPRWSTSMGRAPRSSPAGWAPSSGIPARPGDEGHHPSSY